MLKLADESLKVNGTFIYIYIKISPHKTLLHLKEKKNSSAKEKFGENHINQVINISSNGSS